MKKTKIFLGGYIDFDNAQNINCRSLCKHLKKKKYIIYTMSLSKIRANDINIFYCFRPYKFTTFIAMLWGLYNCDIAYLPKHINTPKIIVKLFKIFSKPIFTTIEMNVSDRSKSNLIDNFGGLKRFNSYFSYMPNIYGITQFIIDNNKSVLSFKDKVLPLGVENDIYVFNQKKKLKKIVFIGSLIKRKRLSEVLSLAVSFPDLEFHIIGQGNDYAELKSKSTSNVFFYGHLKPLDISKTLSMMDLLFLPSKSEGFPKVILEAAASGIPSLVYSDYGASEWITHNENGFIANSYDDVVRIVSILKKNSDLFTSCSKSVANLANRFDWTETIKIWEVEIENILNA